MDTRNDHALCQSTVCRPESKGGPREANGVICDSCAERFPKDLEAISDMWEDLVDRVGKTEDYVLKERIKSTNESHGLDINQQVSDAKTDLIKFTWWMASMIIDNTTTVKLPADQSTDVLLAWIARRHPGMFTRYLDSGTIVRAVSVAHKTRSNVHRHAYPSGARRVDIPGGCMEHATSEEGERISCPGELFGIIRPGDSMLPSEIKCSEDPEHAAPASDWMQLGRRYRQEGRIA